MFLVSAVKTSFSSLIYHGSGMVVHLLLLIIRSNPQCIKLHLCRDRKFLFTAEAKVCTDCTYAMLLTKHQPSNHLFKVQSFANISSFCAAICLAFHLGMGHRHLIN